MKKLFLPILSIAFFSCATQEPQKVQEDVWHKNASIYEVNVRQYTEEGTFEAFLPHIDRIHDMGIDILWFMPIHPIGEENRKGGMGSYYSVKDYKGVNPEHGTDADFRAVVEKAHSLGMKVLIDWVANHSAFDNVWAEDHKDWYTPDSLGNMQPPLGTDWWDVADLNYDNAEMRLAMIDAMQYWLRDFDIDGFRCDVASWVPNDFWSQAIDSLNTVKPVFMLAEADEPSLHQAGFDMTYTWEYMHVTNEIAQGKMSFDDLDNLMAKEDTNYSDEAYRLYFTTNHDENSWKGDVFERYGDTHLLQAVLAFTIDGMPLVYSGQEAGLNKRLEFFEKDLIDWGDYAYADFYSALLKLHKNHPALWNGKYGGEFSKIDVADTDLYCYQRVKGEEKVMVFLNFSESNKTIDLKETNQQVFAELFTEEEVAALSKVELGSLGYKVFYTK
jgi:glycosidase